MLPGVKSYTELIVILVLPSGAAAGFAVAVSGLFLFFFLNRLPTLLIVLVALSTLSLVLSMAFCAKGE
ncbi:hypothetical protein ACQ86N_48555 [Puia sp. P3]|uniref:hypothetical protein n=1 Tax=Puia sp. P3 TaxID=3423952 RepID=UPI003D666DF8